MIKGISRFLSTNRIIKSPPLEFSSLTCERVLLHRQNNISFLRFLSFYNRSCRYFSMSGVLFTDTDFLREKDKYLNFSLAEKRSVYKCKSKYVTVEDIPPWSQYSSTVHTVPVSEGYSKNEKLNEKVSIFRGDITTLEIDAIVNAANHLLRGGGGVDGAIHAAAGSELLAECKTLKGCGTGEAKITGGYKLPAKYVIHTVGPVGEDSESLRNCYQNSLSIAKQNALRTIAFPCLSTGVFLYPNESAAHVALKTVRTFLEQNESSFDRVIFCLFMPVDVAIYEKLMQEYFPV